MNHFTDVYRNAINLGGSAETTFLGGSFQMIGNGACPTVFNNGCEDVLLQGVRFRNGVSLTFDPNLTEETIEFKDCPGFVDHVHGWFDGTTLSNGKTVISRPAFTYTAADAAEALKIYRAVPVLSTAAWSAGGNNPFMIHRDEGNVAANNDVRFLVLDETGAVCNTKAASFTWDEYGPRKFPIAA
jgi:hypothetical protein